MPHDSIHSRVSLVVEDTTAAGLQIASEVRKSIGLTESDSDSISEQTPFALVVRDGRVELRDLRNPKVSISADFVTPLLGRRIGPPGRNEPLARAVGLGSEPLTVVDATAGLGGDAFRLATWGCRVTAVERDPIVAMLLRDGLRRAMAVPQLGDVVCERVKVVVADGVDYLAACDELRQPDVVYLDPMFSEVDGKSAAVRKEMALLRAFVGEDDTGATLLSLARSVAKRRVVVKRMRHAESLGTQLDLTYRGSVVRYDVYLNSA